jgi:hypothetical protein
LDWVLAPLLLLLLLERLHVNWAKEVGWEWGLGGFVEGKKWT